LITIRRPQLEESWCLKVEEARERYQAATKQYREALLKQREGLAPGPDDSHAVTLAREAESRAIAEYERVLLIFTELILHGRLLEEQSA
jgi:predicted alternative tryptophan synthase beta-subunit